MVSIEKILADNIRRRRVEKGWTQTILAREAGLSLQTITRFETGKQPPRRKNLEAVASALGCSREDLLSTPLETRIGDIDPNKMTIYMGEPKTANDDIIRNSVASALKIHPEVVDFFASKSKDQQLELLGVARDYHNAPSKKRAPQNPSQPKIPKRRSRN